MDYQVDNEATPEDSEFDDEGEIENLAVAHADIAYQEFFATFDRLRDEGYSLFPLLVGLQRCVGEVTEAIDEELHQ